jgi:hypothetical protein
MKISNANKRMIDRFFNNPVTGVVSVAVGYSKKGEEPHTRLMCAIIESGFTELDTDYIKSETCADDCEMIFFSYYTILEAYNNILFHINNNIDWEGK